MRKDFACVGFCTAFTSPSSQGTDLLPSTMNQAPIVQWNLWSDVETRPVFSKGSGY